MESFLEVGQECYPVFGKFDITLAISKEGRQVCKGKRRENLCLKCVGS